MDTPPLPVVTVEITGDLADHATLSVTPIAPTPQAEPPAEESGTQAAAALGPLRAEVLEFLDGVVGVVEANRFEQMMLWSENRRHESPKAWVEHLSGFGQTIGFVGDMPVFVSLLTAEVQGQKILFAHTTSQIVDHRMVDAWLKANMPQSAFWPDGRLNFVDADNFHNVFRAPAPAEARSEQAEGEA